MNKLDVEIIGFCLSTSNHYKLRLRNPKTDTKKTVIVSKTPKPRGRCINQVISDIRKAFRTSGETV